MTARFPEASIRAAIAAVCAAGLASFAALAPEGALAQTSAPLCDPTPTVSAMADANGVYTTTVVCGPRAGKAEGEADWRHIHWNQGGTGRWAVVYGTGAQYDETRRGTGTPANNAAGNHVHLTVQSGVVFDADGMVDMRSFVVDGAVRLIAGGDATVVIEDGAILNINRTPGHWRTTSSDIPTDGTQNWYPSWQEPLNHQGAIDVRRDNGDITVRHNGVINFNVRNRGEWRGYYSNSSAIYVQNPDTTSDATRRDHDILVELGATGVIRHVEGSDGGNGIYAEQTLEDGDLTINLAEGSLIDVTGEGGYGLYARAGFFANSATNTAADASNNKYVAGDVIVNAQGTIKAAVKQNPTVNVRQGTGITAVHASAGRVRVASSGTIETRQRVAIDARAFSGTQNSKRDDASTPAIEGHLVDIAGGTVETRGNTAIYASTGGTESAFTVRVGEGATVRAQALTQEDYDNGAITQEQLGEHGDGYFTTANIHYYGYRSVRLTQDDDGPPTTVTRIEPILTAIAVRNFSSSSPSSGVRDHVIVNGTVETVGASEYDPAIWMERGGALTVGSTGVIKASSGLAIASGCDARIMAAVNTKALWQALPNDSLTPYRLCTYTRSEDLAVDVAGRVEGDIRALRGALTATVADGGVVTGTLHNPQNPFTVAEGASIGRLLWTGDDPITVTVAGGGKLTGAGGKAVESASTDAAATLAVTVQDGGRVEGDILAGAALTATVEAGGVVTATIRNPQTPFTVGNRASIGRLLWTGDSAATVTVADGGTLTGVEGKAVESASTDAAATLAVTVQDGGRVEGDILAGAALTATVMDGGVATGTIRNPQASFTVAEGARIGRILYASGGAVTVSGGGALTGVEGVAAESTAGALTVAVNDEGRVEGDVKSGGTLMATVMDGGVVTGTLHNPQASFTVAEGARIGRILYASGGAVTVSGGGTLTGVDGKAVESAAGALTVTVNDEGRVEGDILSGGMLTADVKAGGVVTGTLRNPGSPMTVGGSVGRILYAGGGTVTVDGAVTGLEVEDTTEAIRADAGNLDVTVAANGAVTGLSKAAARAI